MKKILLLISILFFMFSCRQTGEKQVKNKQVSIEETTKFYSQKVKDTFFVSVSLPNEYNAKKKYPTVYLLDSNLYFDIVSVTFKKYSEIGLIPPVILVGIGYKNLQEMDSLRSRDYTYPIAIPEYEMSISGRANEFLSFINTELVPNIDAKYSVNKSNRILMGHSLGGYFALYAMKQNLTDNNNLFSSYVAASPSTHYNHNFILKEFEKLRINDQNKTKVYIAFGGMEDEEDDEPGMLKTDAILLSLEKSLKEKNKLDYKGEKYSNLNHMDMPLPVFIKGLNWSRPSVN